MGSFLRLIIWLLLRMLLSSFLMRSGLDMIVFRRILYGETLEQCENPRYLVAEHEFGECRDKCLGLSMEETSLW